MGGNIIKQVIDKTTSGRAISIHEVPDIELYMDQVVSFIDSRMEHLKRYDQDKIMTGTMVNNYTKAGLLRAPRKKKYDRSHVLQLMLIYHLKQILSIQDIDHLFHQVLKEDQLTIEQIYELFLTVRGGDEGWLQDNINTQMEAINQVVLTIPGDEQEKARTDMLAMTLVLRAELLKRAAEQLLDNRVSGPGRDK